MIYRETFRLGMSGVDAFGIVYYTKYWEWFGSGVEGLLEAAGKPLQDIMRSGLGFPVAHAEIDYHAPTRLGDRVDMTLELTAVGRRSLHYSAEFHCNGRLVASASTVQVAVATDGGPATVPRWLREAFQAVHPPASAGEP